MTALAAIRRLSLPPGLSRWVRPLLYAAAAVATIGVLALYVFPTRTWIDQRNAIADTRTSLVELDAERDSLQERIVELDTDAEIELIARSQYGLVLPGEEAYAVLAAPAEPVDLPKSWPFAAISERLADAIGRTAPGASAAP